MKEITLVTGASGFIGGHLTEALLKEGRSVRCFVRKTSDLAYLKTLDVELCYGDLRDEQSIERAVSGVSIVYHLAAQVRPAQCLSRMNKFDEIYEQVNIRGTEILAQKCLECGVRKMIFYSSIAAVGIGIDLNEESDCAPLNIYGQSKLKAENCLLELYHKKKLPVLIIRPGQVYGPRSKGMLNFFKLIKYGFFPIIGNGNNLIPVCYVDDLITGTILAEKRGDSGNIFFLFENCYEFNQYMNVITNAIGISPNKLKIPQKFALLCADIKELFEKIVRLKINPFHMDVCKGSVISVSSDWQGSIEKAKKELGYNPKVSLEEGMKDVILYLKEKGKL